MKTGDIVINEWAGNRNPWKCLVYLRKTKRYVYCMALDGSEAKFYNDKELCLTVVGRLDTAEWERLAQSLLDGERPQGPFDDEKQTGETT